MKHWNDPSHPIFLTINIKGLLTWNSNDYIAMLTSMRNHTLV